ncbi:hypothetical protein [Dokdonella soli]|uniref:PEP-CTERM sorting domain-containing protein n=1 Tax=Dokdonella soli TaxID=529810 RepID=A0ABN1IL94_9GAMM
MYPRLSKKPIAAALGLIAILAAQGAGADAPLIAHLQYSADIGANIVGPGLFAARKDFVDDDLAGARQRMQIAGLPDNAVLHDFHIEGNGNILFALDIGVTLGGTYFDPADVIRFSGSSFSKQFDAAAAGVPRGVHCDGVARLGSNGPLLLSFDKTFSVGGITIQPADVIAFSGNAFGAKLLDARALGLSANLNVDAIDTFGTKSYLLVSFDTGGTIAGITFADEDVMQLHLTDGTWSKRFTLLNFSDRWGAANLDGLAATNNDTIFEDDFQ